jgi:hypothetical protein
VGSLRLRLILAAVVRPVRAAAFSPARVVVSSLAQVAECSLALGVAFHPATFRPVTFRLVTFRRLVAALLLPGGTCRCLPPVVGLAAAVRGLQARINPSHPARNESSAEPHGFAGLFSFSRAVGTCPGLGVSFRKRPFRFAGAASILEWDDFWSAAFQRRFLSRLEQPRKKRKRR